MNASQGTELKYVSHIDVLSTSNGVRTRSTIIKDFNIWSVVENDHGTPTQDDRKIVSGFLSLASGLHVRVQYNGSVIIKWTDGKHKVSDLPMSDFHEVLRLFNEAATDETFLKATEFLRNTHSRFQSVPEEVVEGLSYAHLTDGEPRFKNWEMESFELHEAREAYTAFRLILRQESTERHFDAYYLQIHEDDTPDVDLPIGGEVFPAQTQTTTYQKSRSNLD